MLVLAVFTLVGLLLGVSLMGQGGWLTGAIVGFLLGQLLNINNKLANLTNELEKLKAWRRQQESNGGQQVAESRTRTAVTTAAVMTEPSQPETQLNAETVKEQQPVAAKVSQVHIPENSLELELPDEAQSPNTAGPAGRPQAAREQPLEPEIPATAPPPKSLTPKTPDPVSNAVQWLKDFFTQGNPIVRAGMVVMFFGLSFLAKYAAGQGFFPIEFRLAIIALVSVALVAIGWKTRNRAGGYGLVLQGGGVAALYLTLFAAAKMFGLMPLGAALAIMILVVMLGAALALLQNAQVLAIMATAGGFLAPILTSDGSGNHVGLFSYYLVLNLGVLTIAWFKTWRMLNWIGFVFTFVITSIWGVLQYQPYFYASTQPFLLAFFALYLIVSVLFSLKQPPQLTGLVDASLVFGLPVVAFGLQTALLKHTQYGLAISALVLATIYTALAKWLWGRFRQTHAALIESFIALAVCFATLTIPLALGAKWTSASWALEATGLLWIGMRQSRRLPRAAGYLLHMAAACSLLVTGEPRAGAIPLVSGDFLSLAILSLTAMTIAYLLHCYKNVVSATEKSLELLISLVAWGWWLFALWIEIDGHIADGWRYASSIILLCASAALALWLSGRLAWTGLNRLGYTLLPLIGLGSLLVLGDGLFGSHQRGPLSNFGWLALPLFFVLQYRFLWLKRESKSATLVSSFHILTAWFLFFLIGWQINAWENQFNWGETLTAIGWFAGLALPLAFLLYMAPKSCWPFAPYPKDYRSYIPAPLVLLLGYWAFMVSQLAGTTGQFYLPILNPLDLAQAGLILLVIYCIKRDFFQLQSASPSIRLGVPGALAFAWLNLVMLRALHQYLAIAYTPDSLWNSSLVQMALSILWGLCALAVMNTARRWQQRELWLVGVSLLVIILAKLVFKDMSGRGTLAGIISFVAVGALMLIIGYVSPMPVKSKLVKSRPAKEQDENTPEAT